mmetsp:Transcript_51220/g.158691  ORF Transcript_51220/g.158691 Transcript_51220/m.158691 type:complete len:235 (+) Transcript_51220:161-865(+)
MDVESMVDALGDGTDEAQNGPKLYCVIQGALFVKRSSNPESKKIIKLQRPVGTNLHATGKTWRGPGGGLWAQLNATRGETGWVLVDGPGFGLAGPALVDAAKDRELVRIDIVLLDHQALPIFESLVPKDLTIRKLKRMMCQKTGLIEGHCCLGKDPPVHPDSREVISIDYMPSLQDDKTVGSLGFPGAGRVYCIYLDELPQDFKRPEPIKIDLEAVKPPMQAPTDWKNSAAAIR